jgi:hypothetical protein
MWTGQINATLWALPVWTGSGVHQRLIIVYHVFLSQSLHFPDQTGFGAAGATFLTGC